MISGLQQAESVLMPRWSLTLIRAGASRARAVAEKPKVSVTAVCLRDAGRRCAADSSPFELPHGDSALGVRIFAECDVVAGVGAGSRGRELVGDDTGHIRCEAASLWSIAIVLVRVCRAVATPTMTIVIPGDTRQIAAFVGSNCHTGVTDQPSHTQRGCTGCLAALVAWSAVAVIVTWLTVTEHLAMSIVLRDCVCRACATVEARLAASQVAALTLRPVRVRAQLRPVVTFVHELPSRGARHAHLAARLLAAALLAVCVAAVCNHRGGAYSIS
jgi:hypothetical protein